MRSITHCRHIRRSMVALLLCLGCYAQTPQAAATPNELQYFRFVLMNIASIDHSQEAINTFESSLVKQIGLNTQEAAAIHAAGQSLHGLLVQLRQSSLKIVGGKASLSALDTAGLNALATQREQLISTLANQILNSVLPATADRLRAHGNILAAHSASPVGGN